MVFVADVIPAELQRIVEFLNGQMDPAEVLAVEVRQFTGQGQTAMVPRVFGQTATAQQKKILAPAQQSLQWDEVRFFGALERDHGQEVAIVGRRIHQWATDKGLQVGWGKGNGSMGSLYLVLQDRSTSLRFASIWTYGRAAIEFGNIRKLAPFSNEEKRHELRQRFNEIGGINLSADAVEKWPSFPLAALTDAAALRQFLSALDWYVEQVKSA